MRPNNLLRTTLALGLIAVGFLLNLLLVVLMLGEGFVPARLPPGLAAAVAVLGGVVLVVGLFLIEPRRARHDRPGGALLSR